MHFQTGSPTGASGKPPAYEIYYYAPDDSSTNSPPVSRYHNAPMSRNADTTYGHSNHSTTRGPTYYYLYTQYPNDGRQAPGQNNDSDPEPLNIMEYKSSNPIGPDVDRADIPPNVAAYYEEWQGPRISVTQEPPWRRGYEGTYASYKTSRVPIVPPERRNSRSYHEDLKARKSPNDPNSLPGDYEGYTLSGLGRRSLAERINSRNTVSRELVRMARSPSLERSESEYSDYESSTARSSPRQRTEYRRQSLDSRSPTRSHKRSNSRNYDSRPASPTFGISQPERNGSRNYENSVARRSRSLYGESEDRKNTQLVLYRPLEMELLQEYSLVKSELDIKLQRRRWDPCHRAESAFLKKLGKDFLEICDQYYILSVFSVDGPTRLVGGIRSALHTTTMTVGEFLEIRDEKYHPIVTHPARLLKYRDRENYEYSQLVRAIDELLNRVRQKEIVQIKEDDNSTVALDKGGLNQEDFDLLQKHYPYEEDIHAKTMHIAVRRDPDSLPHMIEEDSCLLSRLGKGYFWNHQIRSAATVENRGECLWVHVPGNDRFWADVI